MLEFRKILIAFLALQAFISVSFLVKAQTDKKRSKRGVEIIKNEAQKRVDVLIDGELFTSYTWAENL